MTSYSQKYCMDWNYDNKCGKLLKCGVESFWSFPCYAGRIKILWLGLPSTLMSTENGAFRKRWRHDNHVICLPVSSSNTNPKWRPKWWLPCWFRHVGSTKILLCACSRVHSSVSAACYCCVFKFLRRSVDGKHFIRFLVLTKNIWCVFRVKPPFSNSFGAMWTGPKYAGGKATKTPAVTHKNTMETW